MNEWQIQSRGHVCVGCETHFTPHQIYHSLLTLPPLEAESEGKEFDRVDVCATCWRDKWLPRRSEWEPLLISHWKGLYVPPPPPPPETIRKDTAESLLKKLVALEDNRWQASIFILAAMLERKRMLKLKKETRRDGFKVSYYENVATGEVLRIVDPKLRLDQLQNVQEDVAMLLENGLESILSAPTPSQDLPPLTEASDPVLT